MSKPIPTRPEPQSGQKPAPAAPAPKPKAPRKPSPWPWAPWVRVLVSLLIVFHIAAVFSAPWFLDLRGRDLYALPPRDAQGVTIPPQLVRPEQLEFEMPVLADGLARFFTHYDNLLFLNNGYEFFSPDPIWSHLIEFTVFDAANQPIVEGRFPDRRDQWPRLLYHRYMMLAEQSGDAELDGAPLKIADWLLQEYDGQRLTLRWVRHHLLQQQAVLDGKSPNDQSTYEVVATIERRRGEGTATVGAGDQIVVPGGGR